MIKKTKTKKKAAQNPISIKDDWHIIILEVGLYGKGSVIFQKIFKCDKVHYPNERYLNNLCILDFQ